MSRGLQQDREAKYEAMREATAERWRQVQSAKEDKRYADAQKNNAEQMQYQQERDKVGDARHAEQMGMAKQELNIRISERRTAEIEKNFEVVERKYQKEFETLERQFQRRIDIAKSKDPTELKPGETVEELYAEYNDRVRGLEKKELADYVPLVKSYGPELKGTRYASFVDIVADSKAAADNASKQFLKDAGVVDPAGEFAATETKTGGGRKRILDEAKVGGVDPIPEQPLQPKPSTAMAEGASMTRALSGGRGDRAYAQTPGQQFDFTAPVVDFVKGAWSGQGLLQPKMNPGETPEQYAARTGIKQR
jgi:hypothetical protein